MKPIRGRAAVTTALFAACWGLSAAVATAFAAAAVPSAPVRPAGVPPAARPLTVAPLPLTGPAYMLADRAYRAYARGDYQAAAAQAREAIRQRPDVSALRILLAHAEAALRRGAAPRRAAHRAAVLPPSRVATAPTAPAAPAANLGYDAASAAYAAYDRGEFKQAAEQARRAVRLAPAQRPYRLLLANALVAGGQAADAVEVLVEGIAEAGDNGTLAARLAVLREDMARAADNAATSEAAKEDAGFDQAAVAYRAFAAADYAAAAEAAEAAVAASPSNLAYRRLLVEALAAAGRLPQAEAAATAGLAVAGDDAVLLVRRGLVRQQRGEPALARADLEAALGDARLPVATAIDALLALGRHDDARRRWREARTAGALAKLSDLDAAFLAIRVGEDEVALQAFDRAAATGQLAGPHLGDAAYAEQRAGHDDRAVAYFEQGISALRAAAPPASPQVVFEGRRAVSDVSRQGGVFATLVYGGATSGAGLAPGATANSLQAGVEGYWRPWGYRDGRYAELFARAFETLGSDHGGATGASTRQAAVGIRDKPFKILNLVVSFGRVFALPGGRDDWLAQIGYSGDTGSDLRLDVPAWWTSRVFAETGRYLSSGETYALGHVELGRSLRLGGSDSRWALFPHLSIAADRDSKAVERSSAGVGPGIAARYWFREDAFHAPRSYVELSLQYRLRLEGARRAQGGFMALTLSY